MRIKHYYVVLNKRKSDSEINMINTFSNGQLDLIYSLCYNKKLRDGLDRNFLEDIKKLKDTFLNILRFVQSHSYEDMDIEDFKIK